MNAELEPCPFCGGEAEIWRASGGRTAWVACMSRCAVLVSKEYTTDAEAIAAWNARATPDPLSDPRVKSLVEAARPFYAAVFNDNGDVTISTGHITTADWLRLDAALRSIEEGGE